MGSIFRPFPLPLTGRQKFYLGFLQGFGAGIIDGGVNFAIAYAMYHNQKEIKMWVLSKNTIAGDLGVTPIIQTFASMLITSTLVHTDLHHDAVKPLAFVWPHVEHLPDPREVIDRFVKRKGKEGKKDEGGEAEGKEGRAEVESGSSSPTSEEGVAGKKLWDYYPRMLLRFIFEGTESNILLSPFSPKLFFLRAFLTAAQGAALGILLGLPIFLIFIIVLAPIYRHDNMAETGWKWAPMVIKGVYGAVLGWITNPVIAALALGSQAERHLVVVKHGDEEAAVASAGAAGGVPTIMEDEELVPPRFPNSPRFISTPTSTSLPGTPRLGSTNLAPSTPTRPRARSRASSTLSARSRPPLTADCTDMPTLPPPSPGVPAYAGGGALTVPHSAPLLTPSRGAGPRVNGRERSHSQVTIQLPTPPHTAAGDGAGPGLRETLAATPAGRKRGMTTSTQASEGSGTWSYALGGTGGRAQRRPRAASTLSGMGAGAGAVGVGGVVGGSGAGGVGGEEAQQPQTPGKKTPVWDVFGKVQGAEDKKDKEEEEPDSKPSS
ncbi:hypothetical protein IAT38_000620 [Cryptococcus sp. DSM 104549]